MWATVPVKFITFCKQIRENGYEYLENPFCQKKNTLRNHIRHLDHGLVLHTAKQVYILAYIGPVRSKEDDSFCYQNIVTKQAIFSTSLLGNRVKYKEWDGYYEYLISIPVDQEGQIKPHGISGTSIDDIYEIRYHSDVTRQ